MIRILSNILSDLLHLGINLTGKQYELLKWRTSDEAKQFYSRKENKIFYKELKKGNLNVVDAIRKEKQERINKLKRNLLNIFLICAFCSTCIISCNSIPKKDIAWDINSLKTEEQTFQIKEQSIKVNGKFKSIKFDENWYLVHENFIKTFNENQDTLLNVLEKTKETKKRHDKNQQFMIYGLISIILLFIFMLIFQIFKGKKK